MCLGHGDKEFRANGLQHGVITIQTRLLDGKEHFRRHCLAPEPIGKPITSWRSLAWLDGNSLKVISLQIIHGKFEHKPKREILAWGFPEFRSQGMR